MLDFTTASMHPDEGRDAWREQLAALCGRRATMHFSPGPFSGSIRSREVGGISICRFSHNIREIEQRKLPDTGDRSRNLMLIIQLSGRSRLSQSNDELHLGAGEFAMIDSFRPFSTRFDGPTTQLIAYLPAAEIGGAAATAGLPRPHRLSGHDGLAAIARSTLMLMARSADRFDDDGADCARDMLTGTVRRMLERERRSTTRAEAMLPDRRIRTYIEARLADPDLTPARIAAGCNVSLRRLHRAFSATEWTVGSWIRHRRLERCRADLSDPAHDPLTITQIAFRWGFNDAAHFSRSFRQAYDESPRDLRARGAA
jgi:AraC-like DNA-binding protein